MRVFAYCCTYVPLEIIEGAGFKPLRLLPSSPEKEDALLDPNFCPYVRALLARLRFPQEIVGVVLVNCCDGMRRLYDALRRFSPDLSVYLLDVPRKSDLEAVEYFANILRDFSLWLFGLNRREVDLEELRDKIRFYNRRRKAFLELLQRGPKMGEVLRVLKKGFPPEEGELLKIPLKGEKGRKKVLISGSLLECEEVVRMVEDSGGEAVFLDVCSGVRGPSFVEEKGDPYLNLAQAYLKKPPCGRSFDPKRKSLLEKMISEVEGVVFYTPKFCDHYLHELVTLRELCQKMGRPLLHLESDYNPIISETMRTRIQAFFEKWL
jgi:benzoyl-CoA reductase/2-hydroxyglutaryl-CoA dehydratase subunit BcrC/BadD/HgdB